MEEGFRVERNSCLINSLKMFNRNFIILFHSNALSYSCLIYKYHLDGAFLLHNPFGMKREIDTQNRFDADLHAFEHHMNDVTNQKKNEAPKLWN